MLGNLDLAAKTPGRGWRPGGVSFEDQRAMGPAMHKPFFAAMTGMRSATVLTIYCKQLDAVKLFLPAGC